MGKCHRVDVLRFAGIVWVRDLYHDVYPKRARPLRPRGARGLRFLGTRLSLSESSACSRSEMLRSLLVTSPARFPRELSRAALCIQKAPGYHSPSWELFEMMLESNWE